MKVSSLVEMAGPQRRLILLLAYGAMAASVGAAGMYAAARTFLAPSREAGRSVRSWAGTNEEHRHEDGGHRAGQLSHIVLPKEKWAAAGIRIEAVRRGPLTQTVRVTGKVMLNEDRLAHIFSLVDGRIHEVRVQFGQNVKAGDVLAVIDSKEVGLAKLSLSQNRLDAELAKINNDWNQRINTNTQELIRALEKGTPILEIDKLFGGKAMGQYRQQLLAAYANLHKSKADYERLKLLSAQGVTAGKQALAAKAAYEADQATFLALLEQLKFTAAQQALLSQQKLRQAEQAVAVSQSQLYILGYHERELVEIDPIQEGEAIAHYEIKAPFDGTVTGKKVVLGERVGPDTEMFEIADLSTVWIKADIYEKYLPLLRDLLGKTIRFWTDAYPDRHFEASVFYAGNVVGEKARTADMRAIAQNPDGLLKPGMFMEIELPGTLVPNVLQVPRTAVVEEQGETFVFVQKGDGEFQRRDVKVGRATGDAVEIAEGLRPGEKIAVAGIFALKSAAQGEVAHVHVH